MKLLFRLLLLLAAAPAGLVAQVVVSGSVAAGGGGTLLDGDRPSFQMRFRQHKAGYGGLEALTLTRATDESQLRIDARALPGNEDYRLAARWEKFGAYYVEANYQQFRTFYDGSGGRLLPRDLAISYFDEDLALDRSFLSVEFGTLGRDGPQLRLRYDRNTRDGTKNSTRWGDSNLGASPYSPRAFIPAYFVVEERRDILTAEASEQTSDASWRTSLRHERTTLDNHHVARRRAFEPQDRYVTLTDTATIDLFAGHGFYERVFNEKLRASAGGLVTTIDTHVGGSAIAGDSPDAAYSTTFARRQSGDKGFYGLAGRSWLKQYVGNLNVVYQPTKYWILRPGVKYEHLRVDSGEDHTETAFQGAALTAAQNATEADSRNAWNEFTEDFEARYTRWADWSLAARAVLTQGIGNLVEQSVLLPVRTPVIDRDTNYDRFGRRYTVEAAWYARPGLTFGAQLNYRLKLADYRSPRDNTSNLVGSRDRYPAYLVDQDLESREGSFRVSWRPRATLSLVTRYGYQRANVTSTFDGLPDIRSGQLTRHVITQTATWNATPRLYLTGAVNVTYDQVAVPRHLLTMNSDDNYTTASLGAGYALGKVTDLYLDLNYFRADNYTDDPLVTLPFNAGHLQQSAFLTWVRRQSDRLVYTARYGFASYRDGTYGGQNDFNAQMIYAKVQYKF